jgi:hypothetical protein
MRDRVFTFGPRWLIVLAAVGLIASCGGGSQSTNSTPSPNQAAQSSPSPPKTAFESDLEYVRKGMYTYIWVFARKDGKPLDKDDGAFLRKQAPQVVDWVTTDGGKRVIAGTNFDLEQGNLSLLKKRFVVEDYTGR